MQMRFWSIDQPIQAAQYKQSPEIPCMGCRGVRGLNDSIWQCATCSGQAGCDFAAFSLPLLVLAACCSPIDRRLKE